MAASDYHDRYIVDELLLASKNNWRYPLFTQQFTSASSSVTLVTPPPSCTALLPTVALR